jgi:uncharacterized damage-inducible protein DinB
MNAIELAQRLHRHRAWVNLNLRDAATALTDEQLKAAFPIGQGSIWKSLLHLYGAEYVWFEALQGNEDAVVPGDVAGKLPGNQLGEGGIADLADLREKWGQLERRYTAFRSTNRSLRAASSFPVSGDAHSFEAATQSLSGTRRATPSPAS